MTEDMALIALEQQHQAACKMFQQYIEVLLSATGELETFKGTQKSPRRFDFELFDRRYSLQLQSPAVPALELFALPDADMPNVPVLQSTLPFDENGAVEIHGKKLQIADHPILVLTWLVGNED